MCVHMHMCLCVSPFLIPGFRGKCSHPMSEHGVGNEGAQGIRLHQGLEPGSLSATWEETLTSLLTVPSLVLWLPLLTIR